MDSSISSIPLTSVSAPEFLNFPVFGIKVFRMLASDDSLLHGVPVAVDVSNFRLAFLMITLYFLSLGSIE